MARTKQFGRAIMFRLRLEDEEEFLQMVQEAGITKSEAIREIVSDWIGGKRNV